MDRWVVRLLSSGRLKMEDFVFENVAAAADLQRADDDADSTGVRLRPDRFQSVLADWEESWQDHLQALHKILADLEREIRQQGALLLRDEFLEQCSGVIDGDETESRHLT